MITVYGKPDCMQCAATIRALEKAGLRYRYVDLTQDPEAMALVQTLGYRAAPVVVAGDVHWSGFMPDRIAGLI